MSHNQHSDGRQRLDMGVYKTTDGYQSQPPTPQYAPGFPRRSRLILPLTSTPGQAPKRPRLELPEEHHHVSNSGSEGGGIHKQQVQTVLHVTEYRQLETAQVRSPNTPINNGDQLLSTVNPMQTQCLRCHQHNSERHHLQREVMNLRNNISLLIEEKDRLWQEVKKGQRYKAEWLQEVQYQRESKKFDAELESMKRQHDDMLAALEKQRADSEALLMDERAKSRDLVAELKLTKKKLEASRSNARYRARTISSNWTKNRQQRTQFERASNDLKIELRTAKEDSTRLEQQLKETIDEKSKAEMELIEIKKQQELERRNRDSLATRIEELQDSLNSANRQLEQKEIERRQVQQQYIDVLDKCERQQSQIEGVENLRKLNMKLRKTRDALRRMKEDAELRTLNLDEINRGHTERNVQLQTRLQSLESQQKSQGNYQSVYENLLHLVVKYRTNIGDLAREHGDPPENRKRLKACLERVMEQFMIEAAQVHNSEMTKSK